MIHEGRVGCLREGMGWDWWKGSGGRGVGSGVSQGIKITVAQKYAQYVACA